MKAKRILSLCLIAAIILSCLNFVFAEDEVSVISVGKPIKSVYYDDGNKAYYDATKPPSNANDGNTGTIYYSRAGVGNKDALVMDLLEDCKLAYVEAEFNGGTPDYTVIASKTSDFSADVYELTEQEEKWVLPQEVIEEGFRYVKLDVSEQTRLFRVKEFTVYGAGPYVPEPPSVTSGDKKLPAFENKKVPVSLNKKAVAKMYNDGGYLNHNAGLAVDGVIDAENNNAFISAYTEEDWLRVDLGKEVKISDIEITGYPQYKGAKVDTIPDWYVVMASNSECAYNEAFPEYVVLEGAFTDITGVFHLPEEYKDQKFRYFQITKPEKAGKLDAMIVREFTVNAYENDLTHIASQNKPVIRNGVINYNDALTDGDDSTKANYENAVIDLLTPSYIKNIVATGDNIDGLVYYGGIENTDVGAMKPILEYPDEKYRYIYIDNSVGANISEIEISTYFSDILSVWNYNEEKNIYSLNVKNGDFTSSRNYTAIVSQIDENGKVLTTNSQKLVINADEEGSFEFSPEFAYGVDHVVCNVFREDIIALTNPAVFVAGENKTQVIISDGIVADDKTLADFIQNEGVNNGVRIKANAVDNIEETDVYSVIVYDPSGDIVGFMSDNAKNADVVYEYIAAATDPEGRYTATISLTDPKKRAYYKSFEFDNVYPTDEEIAECITEFKTTDGSNFADLYDRFYTQKRIIDFSKLSFIDNPTVFDRLGTIYAWTRDNVSKWSEKSSVETIDDILSCLKAALILDSAMYSDISLYDASKLYSVEMSKIFIEDSEVTAGLYIRKYSDSEYENVINHLIMCNALSSIKDKEVTKIVENIQKYHEELCVDVNKIRENNIDIYEIAKRLDKSIPDSYYDGLQSEVNAIIDKLQDNGYVGGSGGSGSGGNSGGNSSVNDEKPSIPAILITGEKNEVKEEATQKVQEFNDVPVTHWARKNIEKLAQKGILNGTGENVFEPERQITRAEFVKIAVSAFGITTNPDSKISFDDCDVNDWFYPYVEAGVASKIISGVSNEAFLPNNSIMRQDAAVILDNVLLYLGRTVPDAVELSFTDAYEISPYALQAVKLLTNCKIINGMDDGRFNPRGALTRAQAATLIVNILDFVGGEVSR